MLVVMLSALPAAGAARCATHWSRQETEATAARCGAEWDAAAAAAAAVCRLPDSLAVVDSSRRTRYDFTKARSAVAVVRVLPHAKAKAWREMRTGAELATCRAGAGWAALLSSPLNLSCTLPQTAACTGTAAVLNRRSHLPHISAQHGRSRFLSLFHLPRTF